jgi:ABC-type Mn2+/Zn2+ transport system ATPase subunit
MTFYGNTGGVILRVPVVIYATVRAHFPSTLMLARELVAHGATDTVLTSEN